MSFLEQLFLENSSRIHLRDESLFNLSGLDIESDRESKGFRVAGVLKDFPAAKQGIQQDDLITKIEGQPAAEFSLKNLIGLLHQPNAQFSIAIQHRNEKERTVHFKLPDQPPTKD